MPRVHCSCPAERWERRGVEARRKTTLKQPTTHRTLPHRLRHVYKTCLTRRLVLLIELLPTRWHGVHSHSCLPKAACHALCCRQDCITRLCDCGRGSLRPRTRHLLRPHQLLLQSVALFQCGLCIAHPLASVLVIQRILCCWATICA